MSVTETIAHLRDDPRFSGCIAHIEILPTKTAEYERPESQLPAPLGLYLESRGIRLYSHQSEAIAALRARESIILTTPTASGKTLAFSLPIMEKAFMETDSTALALYPTKALTHDQLHGIRTIEQGTGISLHAAIYDGDTPRDRRDRKSVV